MGEVTKMMLTKTVPMLTKMMGEVGVQMARGVKAVGWNVNRRQCCAAHPAHCTHYTHYTCAIPTEQFPLHTIPTAHNAAGAETSTSLRSHTQRIIITARVAKFEGEGAGCY